MRWFVTVQKLLLIPCYVREDHTFDNKFKINDAVLYVHLSQILFSNFSTDVCFRFADFYQCQRSFKRMQRVFLNHLARSLFHVNKFLEATRLIGRLARWQCSFKRFGSSIAGLCGPQKCPACISGNRQTGETLLNYRYGPPEFLLHRRYTDLDTVAMLKYA